MEQKKFVKKINEQKLGIVKVIKVIDKLMLAFFDNYNLQIYSADSFECVRSMQLRMNTINQIHISTVCLLIETKETEIRIQCGACVYKFIFSSTTNDETFRINKKLNDNLFLSAGFTSRFWLRDNAGNILIAGKHNNWVSDGIIIDNYLITVGYDGVVKKWSIPERKFMSCLCMKTGWITAVERKENLIYIGTQYGEIYEVDTQSIQKVEGSIGAVWNIMNDKNNVYAVSEDGKIVKYDEEMNVVSEIQCSEGWVNAMRIVGNIIIAVTSLGEIILVDKELKWCKTLTNINMWINNLICIGKIVYVVTAEGKVILYNLESSKVEIAKLSNFQLIDIIYEKERDEIIVVDVEGDVYFVTTDLIEKRVLEFPKCHFTSMCLNETKKNLHIATLDGVVVNISLESFSYHIREVSSARIWKIVWEEISKKIVVITTDRKIMMLNEEMTQILQEEKCDFFPTTCGIFYNKILVGDDKGQIFDFPMMELKVRKEYIHEVVLQRDNEECVEESEKAVRLYIDSGDLNAAIYQKRDEIILSKSGADYEIVDVNSKETLRRKVVANSGWNKFPQIQIKGRFIASASVLPHMFETGTLLEIIHNLLS